MKFDFDKLKIWQQTVLCCIVIYSLLGLLGWTCSVIHDKYYSKSTWIQYNCTLYYSNGSTRNVDLVQPEDEPEPRIKSTFFGGSLYIENDHTSNLPNHRIYGLMDMRINKKSLFVVENIE